MNALPWIQLALTLVSPLIVLAVAWGRLTERDHQHEEVDKSILAAIKEVATKVDALSGKTAGHDTDLALLESSINTIRSDLTAMKALVDTNAGTDRQLRHEMREQFQRQINELSLRVEQRASQPPTRSRR